jgi:GNAT superfamily N-acetyltransferase
MIRPARSEEADTLTELAHDAKRHWGYPEHWIETWRDDLTITPQVIEEQEVFVAEKSGEAVGLYGLLVDGTEASLEHMWVHPSAIGTRTGRALMEHAIKHAGTLGVQQIIIDSDPHAEGFYKHLGATRIGEVPADIDGVHRVLPRLVVSCHIGENHEPI